MRKKTNVKSAKEKSKNKHKMRYFLAEFMGNVSIVCSLMFLTFLIIDLFNGTAMFYASELAKSVILPLWMFSSTWAAVCIMITNRRRKKCQNEKSEHQHSHHHHHHSHDEGDYDTAYDDADDENE